MLIETKRGKPNKVELPAGTEETIGNHIFVHGQGYKAVPYEHQEFPRAIFKARRSEASEAALLLEDVLAAKKDDDRQAIYFASLEEIGTLGYDIRQFPLQCPPNAQIKNLQNILSLHMQASQRQEWLDANPGKTAKDYRAFMDSPESVVVNNAQEMNIAAMQEEYFLDPLLEKPVPVRGKSIGA